MGNRKSTLLHLIFQSMFVGAQYLSTPTSRGHDIVVVVCGVEKHTFGSVHKL